MAVDVGSVVAGYRLESVLGRGGMGVVYEATQLSLGRTVALKLLAPHIAEDAAFVRRFKREGFIQAQLEHPHIVTVYEAGEADEGLFIAMRLVRGSTLKDEIVSRLLDPGRALRILGPVAGAIDTAHSAGLVHRDVKPQNILIGARDHAFLADFGVTKAEGQTGVTKSGQFVGTLDYISPEQIADHQASVRSDVYSLTAVLYESLVGTVPFPKKSEAAVIYAHLELPPPKVTEQRPELPATLDEVIAHGMAKDPAVRFESAGALLRAANEAFDLRSRAVIQVPGPIATPEDVGVREPEARVATDERARRRETDPGDEETRARQRTTAVPRGARRKRALISVGAVAALAIAGFALGSAGSSSEDTSEDSIPVTAGALSMEIPPDWRPLGQRIEMPGMRFRDSLGVGPPNVRDTGMIVGQVDADGPGLLPAKFAESTGNPRGEPVKLGELEALRYGALRPEGFRGMVSVFAVATNRGAATIACFSPAADEHLARCERAAGSLEVDEGRAFELTPDDFAEGVSRALGRVNAARERADRPLSETATGDTKASAAADVAHAYERAADEVRRANDGTRVDAVKEDLAAALARAGSAYTAVAAAARGTERRAYRRAAGRARSAERKVREVRERLRQLGYELK